MKFSTLTNGLNIISKYVYHDDDWCAEHDEAFFPGPAPGYMEERDALHLEDLGFTYDESLKSWHVFS